MGLFLLMDGILYEKFETKFGFKPEYFATSSGRFEIIGNHTDHNGGLCVAASCDLAISGYLAKSKDNKVKLFSEGYEDMSFDLNDLSLKKEEVGTSTGLVKGVAIYLKQHGYQIGGFYLVSKSTVFKGAGVSSSAAFESLIGQIFNVLYNDSKIDPLTLAKAGQYSENHYFDKKSGLLDQSAVCFGNISFMDFSSKDEIKVNTIDFPFDDMSFVIVNSGGSHADLSDLYSSIPVDMKNVAKKLGKQTLSEVSFDDVYFIKDKLSESEFSRAKHFFSENIRVKTLVDALKTKNKQAFLSAIKESFISSRDNLKNMMVENHYEGSPLEACDLAYKFLDGKGAAKINGGGFAGSIIVCLPKNMSEDFKKFMAQKYGKSNVASVNINPNPPQVIKL